VTKNIPKSGIEPLTRGFSVHCSTTELFGLKREALVVLERGLEPLHFYKTLEPKPSVYTSFTTPTATRRLLHFKGVEPLAFSLENQYSAIELKMRGGLN
jgi:hypothetical protein